MDTSTVLDTPRTKYVPSKEETTFSAPFEFAANEVSFSENSYKVLNISNLSYPHMKQCHHDLQHRVHF